MGKRHLNVSAAIIFNDARDKVLIAKRKMGGLHGGLWEFPGGKEEPGENQEDCLRREIREELGINISHIMPYATTTRDYTPFSITLHTFTCLIGSGAPQPIGCSDIRWVRIEELKQFQFPEADSKVIAQLAKDFSPSVMELPVTDVLDLHTFRPGEVKPLLEDYLVRCQKEGIPQVRIIHGKGTGTLKRIVHSILKKSNLVRNFYDAPGEFGGWGATIVEIGTGKE